MKPEEKCKMKRIFVLVVFLVLCLESTVFAVEPVFTKEFLDDIEKIKKLDSFSPETFEKIGWRDRDKKEENEFHIFLKEKDYFFGDKKLISTNYTYDKTKKRYQITCMLTDNTTYDYKEKCKNILNEIHSVFGKELKTVDAGFLNKNKNTTSGVITQDYVFNKIRIRFSSLVTMYLDKEAFTSSCLNIFLYDKKDDLKDLVALKLIPQKTNPSRSNANMVPFMVFVDLNDNRVINQDYNIIGNIKQMDNTFIITEYKTEKIFLKYTINRIINTFSIELTYNGETDITEGIYERVNLGAPIF